MKKKFQTTIGVGNVSDTLSDLEAYSYAASDNQQKPLIILWPQDTDQVRRIIIHANQSRTPVTIRGSGTSFTDGSIGSQNIILSTERMDKITGFNEKNKTIETQPGITIHELNNKISDQGLTFPFTTINPANTVGGMIATNPRTKESQQLNFPEFINEVEFVDGTGKQYKVKKINNILGKEGITGVITKARISLIEKPTLTIDITQHDDVLELLTKVRSLKKIKSTYFIEYIDKQTSEELGYKKKHTIIAGYTDQQGKKHELIEVREILKKINSLHKTIRKRTYTLKDPFVTLEKTYDLINWCEKNNIPLHGHIGIGYFYAYFQKEDQNLMPTFKSLMKRIGGRLGSNFGRGQTNKDFVTPEEKNKLIALKQDYDYNNILNPNKLIDYR